MPDIFSIIISFISLAVSLLYTAWRTFLHSGTVVMAQPTIVFFGHDGPQGSSKVVIVSVLFSTSQRGHILENMYVKVSRSETIQTFSLWIFGDLQGPRAAGLYVGQEGVAGNQHFLLPSDDTQYQFLQGDYLIEIYGTLINRKSPILLKRLTLSLSSEHANTANHGQAGIWFNWRPETRKYIPGTRQSILPS